MPYLVGVDIGGTFTDCVVVDDDGAVTLGKALSTPDDFSVGAIEALRDAARNLHLADETELLASTRLFFHASTVADNAVIERTGALTGLVTTKGFADTLLMMRGRTTEDLTAVEAFHAAAQDKPEPIVPRPLIVEVTERVDYKGAVLVALDEAEAERAIETLVDRGVESVAVVLLWSMANASHEQALASMLKKKSRTIYVSLSSEVAPYVGEYERTATTAMNAYVGPRVASYLRGLRAALGRKRLAREPLVMHSYGGVLGIEDTCRRPIGTFESSPAAGVVGSRFIGEKIGVRDILATDMGGTTFKVGVIRDGQVEKHYKPTIARYSLFMSKIWVESIGAGGGSIARIDPESGLLKVGPTGAGARPGPVCYGLGGTEPTVADADLVLGYLNENYFFGGRMRLDKERALAAIEEKIARPLGMTALEAARGIYRITNSHMSDLIRRATVERGYDPRDFTLFAFGGAAPVHAGRYAAELGIQEVIVPLTASVHGATGLVSSDVVYEYGRSDRLFVPADPARVNRTFSELISRALGDLGRAGFRDDEVAIIRSLDMRYRYQVHELSVPFAPGSAALSEQDLEESYRRFDDLYEQAYGAGSAYREVGREIVNFRLIAVGPLRKPVFRSYRAEGGAERALKGSRPVYFEDAGGFAPGRIYDFDRLRPGAEIDGPAVIETPITTIVVNPKDRASVDEFLNVRVRIGG